MKKQQETRRARVSGHNLSRKGKIQNKNTKTIQKQKKPEASHFAAETAGAGVGRARRGWGARRLPTRALPGRATGGGGCLGPAAAGGQKGKRVQGLSAAANSEKKTKIGTHAVSSSPTNCISKMCSGASKVLVTSFISLFTPKLSLKLNTPRNKA